MQQKALLLFLSITEHILDPEKWNSEKGLMCFNIATSESSAATQP